MTYKPLPVGTDDFGKLINMGYYYIDKTLLIKELIDKKGEANLFIRPRRFGKTLNMSMLQYFFEDTGNEARNLENSRLFSGLKIMSAGDRYLSEQNHYPVISLSLKSAKQSDWTLSFLMIRKQIAQEFKRHQNILEKLSVYDRKTYEQILEMPDDMGLFLDSLAFLSHCLEKAYGEKVIVLIDEYDVPLENAYFNGFYRQMIEFIRSLFESVLKTNSSLYFAVITGCLRITKESIFTGLNNLKINSILNCNYDEYFGFTQAEIQELLETYGCEGKLSEIQEWYDGYLFGKTKIYNPWSVLNYLDNAGSFPIPYWSNTSSNNIIRTLIEKADSSVRAEIEDLIAGKTIEKPVHGDITYEDISSSMDNLWNFLFFTGYLKQNGQRMVDSEVFVTLSIPNTEVRQLYKTKILGWFQDELEQKDLSGLYQNMLEGNVEAFQCDLTNLLQNSISFYDNVEAFYHGFMAGVLGQLKSYIVRSNRESGDGRYDILVRSTDVSKPVIIMEFKASRSYPEMESAAARGLMQIQEKEYAREFKEDGYTSAVFYGIAFYKKNCIVQMQKEKL